jgi:hypothetical protein
MYVKLISSDGHEFIVKREHALTSGTIKAMLSGPGKYSSLFSFLYLLMFGKHVLNQITQKCLKRANVLVHTCSQSCFGDRGWRIV